MQIITEKGRAPIKAWVDGVELEEEARQQLRNVASLPFIHHHIAVMPDCHWGMGATVGSVIPTVGAIVPAAVGVDIGCGMMAQRTTLRAERSARRPRAICARRSSARCRTAARATRGSWQGARPARACRQPSRAAWRAHRRTAISASSQSTRRSPQAAPPSSSARSAPATTSSSSASTRRSASGSCCTRARAASATASARYFIERAKDDMRRSYVQPARRGPRLPRGRHRATSTTTSRAVGWAQDFARTNRELMMERVLDALREQLPPFTLGAQAVNCHHNYVAQERHFGEGRLGDAQGRGARRRGRARHHPGLDGRHVLHRPRQGQPRELPLLLARRRPARCRAARRSGASRSPTTRARRPASSAARTPA